MPPDPEQNIRFLGNRMMIEIVIGRQLTREEQIKLFNRSTKTLEKELFGEPLDLDLTQLNLRKDWRKDQA